MLTGYNGVVDLSHHNDPVDLSKLRAAGIIGVIHKATQGLGTPDAKYKARRVAARKIDLLWGAYHFGTDDDGVAQADNFLEAAGDTTDMVLCLDFEKDPGRPSSMNLDEARAFVNRIHDVTGRYPVFYSGDFIKERLGEKIDPVLSKCWFWLAQYGSNAEVPPNWSKWTLWQYTDGKLGPQPREVEGVGHFDRDLFNGSEAELRAFSGK